MKTVTITDQNGKIIFVNPYQIVTIFDAPDFSKTTITLSTNEKIETKMNSRAIFNNIVN